MATDVPNGALFAIAVEPVWTVEYLHNRAITAEAKDIPRVQCLAVVRRKGPDPVGWKRAGDADYMFHLIGRVRPTGSRGVPIVDRELKDAEKSVAVLQAKHWPLRWKLSRRELYVDALGILAGSAMNFLDPEEMDEKTVPILVPGWEERLEGAIVRSAQAVHLEYGAARSALESAGVELPPLWEAGDPYYDPDYRKLHGDPNGPNVLEADGDEGEAITSEDVATQVYNHARCAPSHLRVRLISVLTREDFSWDNMHEPQEVLDTIQRLREVILRHKLETCRGQKSRMVPKSVKDLSWARYVPAPISPPSLGVLFGLGYGLYDEEETGTSVESRFDSSPVIIYATEQQEYQEDRDELHVAREDGAGEDGAPHVRFADV